jgi:hypothetical protein
MVFQGTQFYHGLLRKYVVVFGNYFNNLIIERTDEGDNTTQVIKVPLQYAPKDKMVVRLNSDPNLDRPAAAILPILSFELTGMSYDASRKLDTMNKVTRRHPDDKNKFKVLYEPVPYNLNFNLYIYSKNQEDNNKILEQILPFFTPDWTATVELIPDMGITRDIPLVLLPNPVMQDMYDGNFKERRVMVWTLSFIMNAYLYGPVRPRPMIKFTTMYFPIAGASTNAGDGGANTTSSTNYMMTNTDTDNAQDYVESITGQPGLDANGNPTSLLSDTIDWKLIDVNDDFGFVSNIEENLNE